MRPKRIPWARKNPLRPTPPSERNYRVTYRPERKGARGTHKFHKRNAIFAHQRPRVRCYVGKGINFSPTIYMWPRRRDVGIRSFRSFRGTKSKTAQSKRFNSTRYLFRRTVGKRTLTDGARQKLCGITFSQSKGFTVLLCFVAVFPGNNQDNNDFSEMFFAATKRHSRKLKSNIVLICYANCHGSRFFMSVRLVMAARRTYGPQGTTRRVRTPRFT